MTTPATTPADGELLCCPCCGGKAEMSTGYAAENVWPHGEFHRVYCGACQLRQLFHRTPAAATAAWNRRCATPSQGKAPKPIYQWRGSSSDAWRDCPKVQYEYVGEGIAGSKPGTYGASWERRIVYASPGKATPALASKEGESNG